jgi:signal transduction histidine kinase
VKKIVDDHQGALQIQSVEGKGTTVVVSLCAAEGVG